LITQSTVDDNILPRYLAGSIRQQEHSRSNNIVFGRHPRQRRLLKVTPTELLGLAASPAGGLWLH